MPDASARSPTIRRKYKPGQTIFSPFTVIDALLQGEHFYHNHKFLHNGWISSWPLRMIKSAALDGHLRLAILVSEHHPVSRKKPHPITQGEK